MELLSVRLNHDKHLDIKIKARTSQRGIELEEIFRKTFYGFVRKNVIKAINFLTVDELF